MGRVLDHKLARNTLLLTVFAFASRGVGLFFQSLVSRSLGAAGLGEFQLLLSIHGLAATLAVSGVRFAVTRLAAEALGRGPGSVPPDSWYVPGGSWLAHQAPGSPGMPQRGSTF